MVRVTVPIPGRAYDVVVGQGVIDEAASLLPEFPKAESAFVVADRDVADRWFDRLAAGLADRGWSCTMLTVPAGEEAKTLDVYVSLLHQLATQEAHRDDLVVALGGGVGRRPGGVRRLDLHAGHALRAGADDAPGAGRRRDRREDGREPARRQEPGGDVRAAARRARRRRRPWPPCPIATSAPGWRRWRSTGSRSISTLLDQLETDPAPVLAREPDALETLVAAVRPRRRRRPSPRTNATRAPA